MSRRVDTVGVETSLDVERCSLCGLAPEQEGPCLGETHEGVWLEVIVRAGVTYEPASYERGPLGLAMAYPDGWDLGDLVLSVGEWRGDTEGLLPDELSRIEESLVDYAETHQDDMDGDDEDRAYDEWRDRQWEDER